MTEPGATLVVRTAVMADAPSIAAIGRVAFPAVHNDVVGPEFAAVVVEQTYSIEALTECITRCTAAIDAEFLVAEQDGDVIGYLPLRLRRARARTPPHLCRSWPEARW